MRRNLCFVLLAGLLAAGCPHKIAYRPRTDLVDRLGEEETVRQLTELLNRAIEPPIGSVEFRDDHIYYRLRHSPGGQSLYYANVDRVDLYENNYVYLYSPGDVFLAKFLFGTPSDSERFADLVLSFREHRVRGGSPGPRPGQGG